jgi:hypothetical protein
MGGVKIANARQVVTADPGIATVQILIVVPAQMVLLVLINSENVSVIMAMLLIKATVRHMENVLAPLIFAMLHRYI